MTFAADSTLQQALQKRIELDALRTLRTPNQLIDFCSNDYLGFSRSAILEQAIEEEWETLPMHYNGATGSRLISGNTIYAENLENFIAAIHEAEAGLIYNSGYDANVGLFSALGQNDTTTTFVYDELIHASIHDGIKLSRSTAYLFKHNDLYHLEERLKIARGTVYVAVESIYSMDGDQAPLKEMVELCEKYNANLIVDEAHATGITVNQGKGLVQLHQLEKRVFARIHTFGKAMGCHGAIVVGSSLLRSFLINFSRSFIYTTALPMNSLVAIHQAYKLLLKDSSSIQLLFKNIELFKQGMSSIHKIKLIESDSAIQSIIIKGNEAVRKYSKELEKQGLDIRPILSPTVPKGKERLRICIHAFNTALEINTLVDCIRQTQP
ncbi:MAG TPA: pyridoxal phosphate-dependent aminotransferase family protein [Bacteroidia bacterium]|jgi:8-amino-7-oxononanoate synthase|nr:pyridoxal phosphate-dependent aminotransferase family protein [Bacteroidia bacterium]